MSYEHKAELDFNWDALSNESRQVIVDLLPISGVRSTPYIDIVLRRVRVSDLTFERPYDEVKNWAGTTIDVEQSEFTRLRFDVHPAGVEIKVSEA